MKRSPMSWADSVKATALAALAEGTATASSIAVNAPWTWNPHDVWLTRVQRTRNLAVQSPENGPTTQRRQGVAHLDAAFVNPPQR